ncbi:hypothetical protein STRTUCAR8_08594 [Streptomyces turgidiscabies Car8]|uniref:Uncharacterized protein n=1 Tax=Streptomyces turgidiscabies (strain Car8) TaxID=698760 RepID=L7F954_STRT8|nr:DUF6221 family protein [Streptomyces turgidiscabies]ELP67634.1 hypothetical protein STRTUCAR8_08594 [Streptomyces turgidiscabies Car8]
MSGVDLAQWLGAQFAEDERIARAACDGGGGWKADEQASCECCTNVRTATGALVCTPDDRDAPHIAEWSPARVLREIDGRRRTVIRCQEEMLSGIPRLVHFAQQTLREMALGYSHRPGYAEAVAAAG